MTNKHLEDELLEKISGGVLKEQAVEQLLKGISIYRSNGHDKFDYMRFLDNFWKDHPNYFSTDNSKEDYDKVMKMILDLYDTYEDS